MYRKEINFVMCKASEAFSVRSRFHKAFLIHPLFFALVYIFLFPSSAPQPLNGKLFLWRTTWISIVLMVLIIGNFQARRILQLQIFRFRDRARYFFGFHVNSEPKYGRTILSRPPDSCLCLIISTASLITLATSSGASTWATISRARARSHSICSVR